MTEQTKLDILAVYSYSTQDFNAANAQTAIEIMFDEEQQRNPLTLIELFIANCHVERFTALKNRKG